MKIVVFTDLDATLLDSETYSWIAARESLQALKEFDAAVTLVSSKTFAEMEPLHRELELHDPFVVENGGGIFFPPESPLLPNLSDRSHYPIQRFGDYVLLSLGIEYDSLVLSLMEISQNVGLPLVGFSSMSDSDVADLTGLNLKEAGRARIRLFDEPFVIHGDVTGKEEALQRIAAAKGLTAVQGGRFWHLIGHAGKGVAVAALIEAYHILYEHVHTVGLGDSPNDFPFLELVDRAIFVDAAGKFLELPETIKNVKRTDSPGPQGWNEAILEMLQEFEGERQ